VRDAIAHREARVRAQRGLQHGLEVGNEGVQGLRCRV
jgi:hypothetical protein